jgi:hypothetical protein
LRSTRRRREDSVMTVELSLCLADPKKPVMISREKDKTLDVANI